MLGVNRKMAPGGEKITVAICATAIYRLDEEGQAMGWRSADGTFSRPVSSTTTRRVREAIKAAGLVHSHGNDQHGNLVYRLADGREVRGGW